MSVIHRIDEVASKVRPVPKHWRRAVCGKPVAAKLATCRLEHVTCMACRDIATKQSLEMIRGQREKFSFIK